MNTLLKLQNYAGGRKILLPLSLFLSAISSLAGMLPYIFIWFIIKEFFHIDGNYSQVRINTYAWWAVGTAMGSVILYFIA